MATGAIMAFDISFLFQEYRRRVLALLLLHPNTKFHVREIARLTSTTAGTLHKELTKLAKSELLLREKSSHQVYYQANTAFPIFKELTSILQKTSGLSDILKNALTPLAEKIEVAFIFGSISSGTENSRSDVDILIIGEIGFTEVVKALYHSQLVIEREINPKIYSKTEWKKLIKNKNAFLHNVINKPKIFLIGTVDDLE